jgi:hypothetical protein
MNNMNKKQLALEFRKAVEYFIGTLDVEKDEEKILEIPTMFPKYKVGVKYKTKEIFSHGINNVGDPQLYQVLQDHTSSAEWTPDTSISLYKAIGISENGIPNWVQPLGQSDSYMIGNECMDEGIHYRSTIDYNVWKPSEYPQGWEVVA